MGDELKQVLAQNTQNAINAAKNIPREIHSKVIQLIIFMRKHQKIHPFLKQM